MIRKTPLYAAISCVLAHGALYSSPVIAQNLTDEEDDASLEEVMVTGSRITKDVFTSSTPLDVIDIEEASIQGIANVGELLQRNTVASGSPQITSAISAEGVVNGGLGTSTLSLRGLGANRTLVLLNGRRAGPSGVRGGVSSFDLGVLPLATIERVEILKDGASSIYGSDAVAGVVNIITRKEDGGTVDAFFSAPSESGGEEARFSASWGQSLERGNFRVTADYNKREELARGDRDYFECGNQFIFNQGTNTRGDATDPRRGGDFRCRDLTWGHIWIYDYGAGNIPGGNLAQFDYDNDLGQYIPGYGPVSSAADLSTPNGWFPVGYDRASDGVTNSDHPFQDAESLIPESETITLYAEGEFNLTDSVTLYSEALMNRRTTTDNGYRQYWTYVYSGNFDFVNGLCDGCGSQLSADAGWFGQQWFSPTAITDHSDSEVEIDYTRFLAGIRGDIGATSWSWDVTAGISRSDGDYTSDRIFNDSIQDNWFASGSCVGTTSSVRGVPCVDVPWFSEDTMNGVLPQNVRDFLFGTETGNTEYTQWAIDGFITGELYDLPAGPLSGAFGFHYRDDEIDDLPGEITLANNAWGSSGAGNTVGDDQTQAIFAEFDAPLLQGKTLAENVTFNASARYTDVDSYGDDTTWKVGVNWQFNDWVRLRANRGTSFRTPALFELFLADQTSFASQRNDPCIRWGEALAAGNISQTVADNCAADPVVIPGQTSPGIPPDYTGGTISATVVTGGGLGVLEAETSTSETIGLIFQPSFADISASIDYFDITIKDEVDQLGASNIIFECYASNFGYASGGTEPLCNQFDRSGVNGGIDNVADSFLNIAEQTNRGFDYQVRYNTDVPFGALSFELEASRQLEDERALFAETVEDLNGLVGDPEWVGEFNVTLDRGAWSFFYGGNYIGSADSERDLGRDTVTYRGETFDAVLETDDLVYHNLSASYTLEDTGWTFLLGLSNVTDEEPPQLTTQGTGAVLSTVGNAAFYSQYDWLGRRAFLNITKTFN